MTQSMAVCLVQRITVSWFGKSGLRTFDLPSALSLPGNVLLLLQNWVNIIKCTLCTVSSEVVVSWAEESPRFMSQMK